MSNDPDLHLVGDDDVAGEPDVSITELLASGAIRSRKDADPMALAIFYAIRAKSLASRSFLLAVVEGRVFGAASERVVLARRALTEYQLDHDGEFPAKGRYTDWRDRHSRRSELPSASMVENTFGGTWAKVKNAMGVSPTASVLSARLRARGKRVDADQIVSDVRRCSKETGIVRLRFEADYKPWAEEVMVEEGRVLVISAPTIRDKFGSWKRLLVRAGLIDKRELLGSWTSATGYYDEVLRDCLHDCLADPETPADTFDELQRKHFDAWRQRCIEARSPGTEPLVIPAGETYRRRFGDWRKAIAWVQTVPATGPVDDAQLFDAQEAA